MTPQPPAKLPNPPLVLVAAEIRFPYAPRLKQPETRDHLVEDLYDITPLSKNIQQAVISFGPTGFEGSPPDDGIILTDRASVTAVTVFPTRLTVETTRYHDFPAFYDLVKRGIETVAKHGGPAALERVGVRYVNEIRVREKIEQPRDWSEWINPLLTGPVSVMDDGTVCQFEASLLMKPGPHRNVVLRYAAMSSGSIFAQNATLQHRAGGSGPFFVADLDGFWQPPSHDLPEFDTEIALKEVAEAHDRIEKLFLAIPTDRLMREVFQRETESK